MSPTKLKAKKKAKSVTFKLASREDLTSVAATLKKGSKKAGSGKLATLAANTTAKLKVKLKGLKKGSYKLGLTAKRANNTTGKLTVKIKVK